MGRIRFGGFPLSLFASSLSNQVGRFVVDRDRARRHLGFRIDVCAGPWKGRSSTGADAAPFDPNAPSLFTALQEELGLKLEATKGPVEVLVIDSIQSPTVD